MKLKIQYTNHTLWVELQGIAMKNQIRIVQKKLFQILQDYSFSNIIVDIQNIEKIDMEAFYLFLDEYDRKYGGTLEVFES